MSSINTNVAAMTALQTLQQTNKAMDETQNRISTGFRVAEAKDNAAYWSIATTMRSDNSSISAVQDALGLGAATVDTAYTGLTASKDVLNEIKNKLTAATQDGVDLNKVQSEIGELQKQLKSISEAASFSGANWLSVNSGDGQYSGETSVVSSYSKAGEAISLGSVKINLDEIKLFDKAATGETGGIMDAQAVLKGADGTSLTVGGKDSRAALDAGGLKTETAGVGVATTRMTGEYDLAGDATSKLTFNAVGDKITFDIAVDGGDTKSVTIARGTVQTALDNSADSVTIENVDDYAKVVQQALADAGVTGVKVGTAPGGTTADKSTLTFTSATTGEDSNVQITNVVATSDTNEDATAAENEAFTAVNAGLETGAARTFEKAVAKMDGFTGPMTLSGDASINFTIGQDDATGAEVKITKQTISDALGTTDGKINSASEFQRVVIQALAEPDGAGGGTGITGVTVGSLASGAVTFTRNDNTTGTESVAISGISVTADTAGPAVGTEAMISVSEIDISKKGLADRGVTSSADIKDVLTAYVNIVDSAIENVTSAASTLGSVSSRIDMQQEFLSKLSDTIDKGIGTLVDADMTEESTRLKALQTQQQLGVQSLSMANASSQNLLSLFR